MSASNFVPSARAHRSSANLTLDPPHLKSHEMHSLCADGLFGHPDRNNREFPDRLRYSPLLPIRVVWFVTNIADAEMVGGHCCLPCPTYTEYGFARCRH